MQLKLYLYWLFYLWIKHGLPENPPWQEFGNFQPALTIGGYIPLINTYIYIYIYISILYLYIYISLFWLVKSLFLPLNPNEITPNSNLFPSTATFSHTEVREDVRRRGAQRGEGGPLKGAPHAPPQLHLGKGELEDYGMMLYTYIYIYVIYVM